MRAYHMAVNFPLYKEILVPSLIFWHVFNEKGKKQKQNNEYQNGLFYISICKTGSRFNTFSSVVNVR